MLTKLRCAINRLALSGAQKKNMRTGFRAVWSALSTQLQDQRLYRVPAMPSYSRAPRTVRPSSTIPTFGDVGPVTRLAATLPTSPTSSVPPVSLPEGCSCYQNPTVSAQAVPPACGLHFPWGSVGIAGTGTFAKPRRPKHNICSAR